MSAATVTFLKTQFGWKNILDLGDITQSRGTETYLALWIRLFGTLKTAETLTYEIFRFLFGAE